MDAMNEDKVRAEFEAWVYNEAARRSYVYMDRVLSRHSNGDYATIWVDMAWIGWIASRAALCVELPDPGEDFDYYSAAISDCRTAIESQGVRTK